MTAPLTFLDNDVLIKGSAFSLWGDIEAAAVLPEPLGVLGAARFVVSKAIERSERIIDRESALAAWQSVLGRVSELEPTDDELALATDLEDAATELGLTLDVGESQLCAMAVHRPKALMLTGDKRALAAAEQLRSVVAQLASLDGRLGCLEQLLHELAANVGVDTIRDRVCSEPAVDTALAICFSCTNRSEIATVDAGGLVSYIGHLRTSAPNLLVEDLPGV